MVPGEDRRNPHGIVHRQPDKPAEQQVVLDLLHQLALRADVVQHLQQHGAQQLFGRDTGTALLDVGFVHFGEQTVHLIQHRIGHLTDSAQWVGRRDEVLQLAHGEQAFGKGVGTAHQFSAEIRDVRITLDESPQQPCRGSISAACRSYPPPSSQPRRKLDSA